MRGHVCLHEFDQLSDLMLKTTATNTMRAVIIQSMVTSMQCHFRFDGLLLFFYLTWRFQIPRGDRLRLDPSRFRISRGGCFTEAPSE